MLYRLAPLAHLLRMLVEPALHRCDVQPVGRAEDHPSPRHMLLSAVAIGDDRFEPSTIFSQHQRTYCLSHAPASHIRFAL
jgi:hypothetical protein